MISAFSSTIEVIFFHVSCFDSRMLFQSKSRSNIIEFCISAIPFHVNMNWLMFTTIEEK